jgi:hypothetical protein
VDRDRLAEALEFVLLRLKAKARRENREIT